MQRVITGKYFSVQYIVSYRDIHAYVYHKYSDTLNTFNMLWPFKQSKRNIQRILLESVIISNDKWDTLIPSKIFISFVELSVLYYLRYMKSKMYR